MSTKKKESEKRESAVEALSGKAREVWLAGLGALASVEEEGNKVFNKLVDKGTAFEERGKKQIDEAYEDLSDSYKKLEKKLKSTFNKAEDEIDENLQELIHKMGVPTQDEIKELTTQVEKLIDKVDQLSKKVDQGEKKAAASKSTASKSK
ncbi:MAG: phasin family protein [Balneolia bacterium]|nr:phasin family protein [Balneolia bacterium]